MVIPLETIRRPADFRALQRDGTGRAHPLLAVRTIRNGLGRTRFGFSTGSRLGGAVVRNSIRRRLREASRGLMVRTEPGWDILVVARKPSVSATYRQLAQALEGLLRRSRILVDEGGNR
jgi:ribonuclease P protein component